MAKQDWENEDFEPKVFQKSSLKSDRWEGEDEEENVKDNWDDEEEEKDTAEVVAVAAQPKKKKNLSHAIAEREEKERREQEERRKQNAKPSEELTQAEALAEKLRRQKLQEEADLELAKETFGVTNSTGIESLEPSTREDFETFRKELVEKVTKYESSPHYITFLEDLCRDFCLTLQQEDIKRITSNLNALATEKLKAQKAAKAKKKSKKATLHHDRDGTYSGLDYVNELEDYI